MQLSHQEHCCYMIGQGASQTASSSAQPAPIQAANGANFNSLAYNPFDAFLPSPIPASANVGDHPRPSVKAPHPTEVLKCPRCESLDTKFCYYNNYSLTQPRYFCKNCKRYWTAGGALRNVPVGGGLRKNKRSKLKLAAAAAAAAAGVVDGEAALVGQQSATHGMHPQSSQSKSVGDVVENSLEQRSASGAMPSNVVVGVPEISQLYSLPSGNMYAMKSQDIDNLISSAPHCSADHMADQNGAHAPSALLHPQAGNLYAKDEANAGVPFFCDSNQLPQFYPSYAACMSMPFGTAAVPNGSVPGYAVNYNFFAADPIGQTSNEEDDSAVVGRMSDMGSSGREVKQESGPPQGPVNTFEWQLISEGLFNSASTSPGGNCSYTPSSSWLDFSQFNDSRSG